MNECCVKIWLYEAVLAKNMYYWKVQSVSSVQKKKEKRRRRIERTKTMTTPFFKNYCFNFFFLILCRFSSIIFIGGSSSGSSQASSSALDSNFACRRSLVCGDKTLALRLCRRSLSRPLLEDGDEEEAIMRRGLILIYICTH